MTPMPEIPVIALDFLVTDAVSRISLFGTTHDVLPIDAIEYQQVQDMKWEDTDIGPATAIVRRVVPSLSDADAGKITQPVIGAILGLAGAPARRVEAALPNSSGPTTEKPTPASLSESPAT